MRSLVAAALAVSTSAQDVFLAQKKDADVLVVGAGMSGMAAAHFLKKAGLNVKVLEAHNYTGGRMHAIQFGDPSVGVHTVEIGAGWLESSGKSGGPEKAPPPVSAMAEEYGMKTVFVDSSIGRISLSGSLSEKVYTKDGEECDQDGSIRKKAEAAGDCLAKAVGKGKDTTVRKALETCGWSPKTDCEWAVDWLLTVDDPGMPADQQSLEMNIGDPVYDWWGPDDRFIVDQRPRGYAGVIDYMVKDTQPEVVFNTKVTNVAYDTSGVTVSTEGGKSYTADAAITTFPIGVLTRHHKQLFTPNVPSKLKKIFDGGKIVMSNLTRVYLQFPKVFWENDLKAWLSGGEKPGDYPEWINLNHAEHIPGSNTIYGFLASPESIDYEAMDDATAQAAALEKLQRSFPNTKIPEPTAFYISRWGYDPLAYGCYSGFKLGFDDDDYEYIFKPLKDSDKKKRVYMAGEAICDDLSGSTYGAYQSGRQSALTYLYAIGKEKKKPLDICWY